MFTGLIEEVGVVQDVRALGQGRRLTIQGEKTLEDLAVDASIAINGCCLTAVDVGKDTFLVDAVEETLSKTTTGRLQKGDAVNLERAMRLSDRLGGHLVLGHVDGVGEIRSIEQRTTSWWMGIRIPTELLRYVIPVGSIAVDGVSLTAADVKGETIFVSIIPHTWQRTNLSKRRVGDAVNIETDMIGKYVEKLFRPSSVITEEWLKEKGF